MKMAKASEADLNMAMELASAFESLGSRWVPAMPDAIEKLEDDQEHEGFDRNDDAQCGRALRYLLDLTDRASLGRVVWGMVVVCDPRNELLDPEADTVEVHPKFAKLLEASIARVVEPIGYVAPFVLQDLKTHSTQACIYIDSDVAMMPIYDTPQEPAAPEWIPVSERLPETGVMVIVRSPAQDGDWTDDDRIAFDHISEDYEDWHAHCESFEHYMAVGGSNAAGPDVVCTGPSQKAPYTHWTPIPAFRKEGQHEQA